MFEGLKKRFSDFVDGLSKKEKEEERQEEKLEERKQEPESKPVQEAEQENREESETEEVEKKKEEEEKAEKPEETRAPVKVEEKQPPEEKAQHAEEAEQKPEEAVKEENEADTKPTAGPVPKVEARPKAPDVSLTTKIKGALLRKVKVSEKDADPFLEQLRVALLQTDVNYDVAERLVAKLRSNLVNKEIGSRDIKKEIRDEIRNSLMQTLTKNSGVDVLLMAREKKQKAGGPFKVLFIGPNGAGKTTTIAKMAHMLTKSGISCVISASDTFRAAAIEQAAIHADRLGVDVIKGTYGADPASIAFDAVAYARAHGKDAVLIDSAGRQETNKSLIEELKKMVRVNAPDLCVFVGEGIAGNALLDQVKQFDQATKLDGVILTKLDVDAKGGNTLSILSDTTVPVLYFGMGERYEDLMPYDPKFVVDNIIPA